MDFSLLLIVPYGIETGVLIYFLRQVNQLLIVPYGIETFSAFDTFSAFYLLIVPYGIETVMTYCLMPKRRNF